LGSIEEEVALEEEGEVLEVSNLSTGIEVLAQCTAAKRRAIMTV
jgi:hypothetical protein